MAPPPAPTGAAALVALRTLVGALMAAPVFIGVALFFVLSTEDDAYAIGPVLLVPVVAGVVSHAVSTLVGYRMPAIAPGTPRVEAESRSRAAFQAATTLRFALSEAVAIICVALAFVVTSAQLTVYVVGAVVAVALIWWHCWPGPRTFARCQASLERDGAQSFLREAYGLPAERGGAIKEL